MNPTGRPEYNPDYTDILIINGWIIFLILIFPLICCTVDKFIFDFSIGPFVFFYWVITTLVMFGVVFCTVGVDLGTIFGFIIAVILGVVFGMSLLNYFIWLTQLFGIMDYHLM